MSIEKMEKKRRIMMEDEGGGEKMTCQGNVSYLLGLDEVESIKSTEFVDLELVEGLFGRHTQRETTE